MLQIETNCERKKNMYRSYDLFEAHPEGKMWKGFAADRETALEKLKELYCLAGHPVMAVNLMTKETFRLPPEPTK